MAHSGKAALEALCAGGASLDVRTVVRALRYAGCTVTQTQSNEYVVRKLGCSPVTIALPHNGKDVKKVYLSRLKNQLHVCEASEEE